MADRNRKGSARANPLRSLLSFAVLAVLVVILVAISYRPDRPVATIVPGSSPDPAFVVQIIRPRLGLPLGGILPPQIFGLEAHLGFDSASAGASIGSIEPGRIEFGSDDRDLKLVLGVDGRVTPESQVVFEFIFRERLRRVRCRPADPAVGTLRITSLPESGELSGNFDIEIARCNDAETGTPLGWPSQPLVLHGSFDGLPSSTGRGAQTERLPVVAA